MLSNGFALHYHLCLLTNINIKIRLFLINNKPNKIVLKVTHYISIMFSNGPIEEDVPGRLSLSYRSSAVELILFVWLAMLSVRLPIRPFAHLSVRMSWNRPSIRPSVNQNSSLFVRGN